jgi:hypothetical protein
MGVHHRFELVADPPFKSDPMDNSSTSVRIRRGCAPNFQHRPIELEEAYLVGAGPRLIPRSVQMVHHVIVV